MTYCGVSPTARVGRESPGRRLDTRVFATRVTSEKLWSAVSDTFSARFDAVTADCEATSWPACATADAFPACSTASPRQTKAHLSRKPPTVSSVTGPNDSPMCSSSSISSPPTSADAPWHAAKTASLHCAAATVQLLHSSAEAGEPASLLQTHATSSASPENCKASPPCSSTTASTCESSELMCCPMCSGPCSSPLSACTSFSMIDVKPATSMYSTAASRSTLVCDTACPCCSMSRMWRTSSWGTKVRSSLGFVASKVDDQRERRLILRLICRLPRWLPRGLRDGLDAASSVAVSSSDCRSRSRVPRLPRSVNLSLFTLRSEPLLSPELSLSTRGTSVAGSCSDGASSSAGAATRPLRDILGGGGGGRKRGREEGGGGFW
eukprot:Rhum_TRINITY_DN14592_c6_g2::Rhum_TRINITY_DN14592_c6_g2_i3::g.100516::m.100516